MRTFSLVLAALAVAAAPAGSALPPADTEGLIVFHKKQGIRMAAVTIVMPNAWDALQDILDLSREPSVRATVAYALASMAYGPDLPEQWMAAQYYDIFLQEDPERHFPKGWLYGTAYLDYSVILWNLGRKEESLDLLGKAVEGVDPRDVHAMASIGQQVGTTGRWYFDTDELEERFNALERKFRSKQ